MTTPWLVAAERSLIAGQFNRAAQNAESVLRNGGVAEDKDYGIRAAFVLLQALYELNRLGDTKDQLEKAFGSITSTPLPVILLWVSLSLEEEEEEEEETAEADAADALRSVLQAVTRSPQSIPAAEHTLEDLQKGVRMYAYDVLAKGGGDTDAAIRWLDGFYGTADEQDEAVLRLRDGRYCTPWESFVTDAKLRQTLVQDIKSLEAPSQQQSAGVSNVELRSATEGASSSNAEPSASVKAQVASWPPHQPPVNQASGGTSGASTSQALQSTATAIQEGGNPGEAIVAEFNWWEVPPKEGGYMAAQKAAIATGAALVLYACFAERRSIGRSMQRVYEVVGGSLIEVVRLAMTLNPNPGAAVGPR